MTYSESAEGVMVSMTRAAQEVRNHSANLSDFARECWQVHAVFCSNQEAFVIDAKHIFNWLGY